MACRFCRGKELCLDFLHIGEHEVAYSMVLQDWTCAQLQQATCVLESEHVTGITIWCITCCRLSLNIFSLRHLQKRGEVLAAFSELVASYVQQKLLML